MKKNKAPLKLVPFDAARYLNDDETIAEYMTAVLETDDPDLLLLALGDVARAKGMAQVAKDAGLGRESLYKALAPGAKPRFDTVMKVVRALGVKLTAQPVARMNRQQSAPRLAEEPASELGEPCALDPKEVERLIKPLGSTGTFCAVRVQGNLGSSLENESGEGRWPAVALSMLLLT